VAELAGLVDGGAQRLVCVGCDAGGSADGDAVRPCLNLLHLADRGGGAPAEEACDSGCAGERERRSHMVRHEAANRMSSPALYAISWRRPKDTWVTRPASQSRVKYGGRDWDRTSDPCDANADLNLFPW
jgi:hypothetical protein